jgi:hypothetical protein
MFSQGRLARQAWLLLCLMPIPAWAGCYCKNVGEVVTCGAGSAPCPSIQSDAGIHLCCVPGDTCGADSLCHFTHANKLTSGFYLGGCTDPTFQDPLCAGQCGKSDCISFALFQPCIVFNNWPPIKSVVTNKGLDIAAGHTSDVVYNSVSNLWSCCSYPNGTTNCELPTDDTFAAISPEQFSSTATSSSSAPHTRSSTVSTAATNSNSAPAASTSPSSSISGSSNTATPPPASDVSSGLSTGAKAGIGVGCSILGIAVLTGVVFLVRRRSTNITTLASSQLYEAEGKPKEYYATAGRPGELSAENHGGELASQPINELA